MEAVDRDSADARRHFQQIQGNTQWELNPWVYVLIVALPEMGAIDLPVNFSLMNTLPRYPETFARDTGNRQRWALMVSLNAGYRPMGSHHHCSIESAVWSAWAGLTEGN